MPAPFSWMNIRSFGLFPRKRSVFSLHSASLAEAKGRPPALAEAMADKDLKVYHVRNLQTGQETYISERELNAKPDQWKNLGAVAASGNDRFLALTGQEAADVGLANALVGNRHELAKRYGLNRIERHRAHRRRYRRGDS